MKEVISYRHSTKTIIEEDNIVIYDLENGRTLGSAPVEDVFFAIWDEAEELPRSCQTIKFRKKKFLEYMRIREGQSAIRIDPGNIVTKDPENIVTKIYKSQPEKKAIEDRKFALSMSEKILSCPTAASTLIRHAEHILKWIYGEEE